MHKGLIIDFNSVAAYLAHESDQTQADFLNTFIKELEHQCGTRYSAEQQLEYVRLKLSEKTIEHLGQLTFKPE